MLCLKPSLHSHFWETHCFWFFNRFLTQSSSLELKLNFCQVYHVESPVLLISVASRIRAWAYRTWLAVTIVALVTRTSKTSISVRTLSVFVTVILVEGRTFVNISCTIYTFKTGKTLKSRMFRWKRSISHKNEYFGPSRIIQVKYPDTLLTNETSHCISTKSFFRANFSIFTLIYVEAVRPNAFVAVLATTYITTNCTVEFRVTSDTNHPLFVHSDWPIYYVLKSRYQNCLKVEDVTHYHASLLLKGTF